MASRKPTDDGEGRLRSPLTITTEQLERRLADTDDPDERAAIREELVRRERDHQTR